MAAGDMLPVYIKITRRIKNRIHYPLLIIPNTFSSLKTATVSRAPMKGEVSEYRCSGARTQMIK